MTATGLYDLAVIGGGINGAGIARDAAGRGLRVALIEQDDLASGTSSASTKLIHGGLRYLEHFEFRLVREALIEREVLLNLAPHIIWPLRFVLPHVRGMRPRAMLRLGLLLYDHLGGRKILPGTRTVALDNDPAGAVLKPEFRHAFEYSDCWADDARLVVLNVRDAADRGATVLTRTKVVGARPDPECWRIELVGAGEARGEIRAKALVNATGPWTSAFFGMVQGVKPSGRIRLVKGSHIVVDRLFDHDRAYIFQNADRRICFAIPYESDFTLIGTTDEDFHGAPGPVAITAEETSYLLAAANSYFAKAVTPEQIRWSFAGLRPLSDDGQSTAAEATRDYVLTLDEPLEGRAVLSVMGGKITTYRRLAEEAMDRLAGALAGMSGRWTASVPLPGGDFRFADRESLVASLLERYPFLGASEAQRLFRCYGTRASRILGGASSASDLGKRFGASLCERELRYLVDHEWARTADDILWRRTKLGLRMTPEECEAVAAAVADYVASRVGNHAEAATP